MGKLGNGEMGNGEMGNGEMGNYELPVLTQYGTPAEKQATVKTTKYR